uniref:Sulfite reductase n=1 Tax=Ammonifex degensii TaxID=42838 RepID=A0A7C2IZN7_9THEO
MEEIKQVILEHLASAKKSKQYIKDIEKAVKQKLPNASGRDIRKAATMLADEGKVAYFSTGSTTMYCLKGREAETTDKEE